MGQFALGLRSLFFKLAIFVIMASLLAWALGGTLWPRPEVARFDSVSFLGQQWFWRLSVGGKNAGEVRWELINETEDGKNSAFGNRHWIEVSGPVVADEKLYFAGRASMNPAEPWRIESIDKSRQSIAHDMPDRLAVEQQLARAAAGLPIQDAEAIRRQRQVVLDPPPNPADKAGQP